MVDGLESDWLRHSIWVGESLCSNHSNPKEKKED